MKKFLTVLGIILAIFLAMLIVAIVRVLFAIIIITLSLIGIYTVINYIGRK